ncbi:MAG: hypothetical protein EOO27_33230 [Comamonadaceae bacterium]|nr:MAG: hypothetical protein EOO27_33230 [Comamonadaceae bacterium]
MNTSTIAESDRIVARSRQPERVQHAQQRRTQALAEIRDRRTFNVTGTPPRQVAAESGGTAALGRGFFSRRKKAALQADTTAEATMTVAVRPSLGLLGEEASDRLGDNERPGAVAARAVPSSNAAPESFDENWRC